MLAQWVDAGILDEETAARIRAFERDRTSSSRLHWPIKAALAFGAPMLGAGVPLFVSALWDTLSPQIRFSLVMLLVSMFGAAGAFASDRFRGLATALHAVGTVACGAASL